MVNAYFINSSNKDKRHTRNGSLWEPSRLSDSLRSGSCRAGWYLPAWAATSTMCMVHRDKWKRIRWFRFATKQYWQVSFVLCCALRRFWRGSLQNFRRLSYYNLAIAIICILHILYSLAIGPLLLYTRTFTLVYTFLCSHLPLKHLNACVVNQKIGLAFLSPVYCTSLLAFRCPPVPWTVFKCGFPFTCDYVGIVKL